MSAAERGELVTTTTRAVLDLAVAGIRLRHPGVGDRECLLRLAVVRLGPSVAASIYPDLRSLLTSAVLSPIEVALLVADALERCDVRYVVGGSVANSISGEPWSTLGVDIVVAVGDEHVDGLIEALDDEFIVDDVSLRRAIGRRSSVNIFHEASATKIDLCVAGGTPLDAIQLERRSRVQVRSMPPGRTILAHVVGTLKSATSRRWWGSPSRSSSRHATDGS